MSMTEDINLPVNERIALAIEAEARRQAAAVHADADSAWDAANMIAGLELAAGIARAIGPWVAVGDGLPTDGQEVHAAYRQADGWSIRPMIFGVHPDGRPTWLDDSRRRDDAHACLQPDYWCLRSAPPAPTGGER